MFKTLLWWTIICPGAYLYSAGTQYGNLLKKNVLGTNKETGYWLVCPFLGSCPVWVATPQRLNRYTGWLCYGKTWTDWHRLVCPFSCSCPVDTHHKDWTATQDDHVMGKNDHSGHTTKTELLHRMTVLWGKNDHMTTVDTPQRLNCYTGWPCYGKKMTTVDTPQRLNCYTGRPCYGE